MSDYTKTTWVNDSTPAINATNLNKIEDGIDTAHSELATHIADTANPHSVTAAQAGADPAGSASSAVSNHNGSAAAHGLNVAATVGALPMPDAGNYFPGDDTLGTQMQSVGSQLAQKANQTDLTTLATKDSVEVTHSIPQSIADVTDTVLSFDTDIFDTNTMHDTVTNNTRLTCKKSGKYFVFGQIAYASHPAGRRMASILKNSTTSLGLSFTQATSSYSMVVQVTCIANLSVNDYLELVANQNSGGSLSTLVVNETKPKFGMIWIGE